MISEPTLVLLSLLFIWLTQRLNWISPSHIYPSCFAASQTKTRQIPSDKSRFNAVCLLYEISMYGSSIFKAVYMLSFQYLTPWAKSSYTCIPIYSGGVTGDYRLVRWRWDFNWLLQWVTEPLRFYSPLPHRRHWLAFVSVVFTVNLFSCFCSAISKAFTWRKSAKVKSAYTTHLETQLKLFVTLSYPEN